MRSYLALRITHSIHYHEISLPRRPLMADPGRPLIPAKETRTAGGRVVAAVIAVTVPLLEPPPPLPLKMDDRTLWSAAEATDGTVALLKALRRLDQLLPIEFFEVRRSKCPLGRKTSFSSETESHIN